MTARHLLDVDDLSIGELSTVLALAERSDLPPVLSGHGVAMLFEKPSARTRNATEMAVSTLGGHPVSQRGDEIGIDDRESAEDVARTLACYHRVVCARVFDHQTLVRMAGALDGDGYDVSVVNLLSDRAHPCQAIADVVTLREVLGVVGPRKSLSGRSVAYVGDANNVCRSLAKAAVMVGMGVRVAAPAPYQLGEAEVVEIRRLAQQAGLGGDLMLTHDPVEAARGADALYADVWTSMGQEGEAATRRRDLEGYSIDGRLLDLAAADAVVMHCLPAHRGEEIAADVIDGPRSVVWRQAEHRLGAMRGVLAWLMGCGQGGDQA